MKKLLFSALMLCFTIGAFAQTTVTKGSAKADVKHFVKLLKLDAKQTEQIEVIQLRKYNNLASIESLKNTKPKVYEQKLKAIHYGTDSSLRRMLNKDQMKLYKASQLADRKKNAPKSLKKQ